MKICVVGTGYVGLSLAILISQKYEVVALDIDKKKVDLINKRQSPIEDRDSKELDQVRDKVYTRDIFGEN